MCLLEYYITHNLIRRMSANHAMAKHRDAYFEAVEKMFETTHTVQGNKIILLSTLEVKAPRIEREGGNIVVSLESDKNVLKTICHY
jgi:hypothetical protein